MRILLVKPSPRLGTIRGLQSFQFPEHGFRSTLRRFRPDPVGCTGCTHEVSAIRRPARLTREDCPAASIDNPHDLHDGMHLQKLYQGHPRELWS